MILVFLTVPRLRLLSDAAYAGAHSTKALQTQDVYLSGGILLISASLVVIGNLISDILLAVLDPRIKLLEEIK